MIEFREHRLENGLEVVAEVNPRAVSQGMGFFVKAGPRDETDDVWGVSHFLEHMVFKGTPTRTPWDVNRQIDEMGMYCNAYTSEEQTVYYAVLLPEFQDQALDLLSDIMRPSLRQEDFDLEKQTVIKEIYKSDEEPPFGAYEKCMAAHFQNHPLGRSILGTVESVGGLTPEAMRSYFERRYSPGNIVLVATGKVDFERLVAEAERLCGGWTYFDVDRDTRRATPTLDFQVYQNNLATQEYVIQAAAGPSAEENDRFPARLLATIVGDDSGSRIYWDLVQTGLCDYAGVGCHEYQGSGIFMTHLFCDPQNGKANLERLQEIQTEVQTGGVAEQELDRAKSKIGSAIVLQSERPGNRLFSVGSNWIQRRQYRTLKEALESYRKVTLTEIAAIQEKYPFTSNTTVAVGPLAELV